MTVNAHQQVSILRSRSPKQDVSLLVNIFPVFQMEQWESTDTIMLSANGSMSLLVVPADKATAETVQKDLAMFVLTNEEIEQAVHRCQNLTVTFDTGLSKSTMRICLPGGSSIVLVSADSVSTPRGRERLAQAVASPGNIIEKSEDVLYAGDSSISGSLDEENLEDVEVNGSAIMQEETEPPEQTSAPNLIPSLAISLLGNNNKMISGIPANSPIPIPIDTELFVGRALLVMRPLDPSQDPYWNERIFSTKKRRVGERFAFF